MIMKNRVNSVCAVIEINDQQFNTFSYSTFNFNLIIRKIKNKFSIDT